MNCRIGQSTIDHGHKYTFLLHLAHWISERRGFVWQDHEGLNLLSGHEVLKAVRLVARTGGGHDRDLHIFIGWFYPLFRLCGEVIYAASPALIASGNGDTELDCFFGHRGTGNK